MPELEKVKCSTPDFAEETAKKILTLLPECAGEGGAVDIEKLKQCLSSSVIEGNVERYEFTWPGKRAAKAAEPGDLPMMRQLVSVLVVGDNEAACAAALQAEIAPFAEERMAAFVTGDVPATTAGTFAGG